MPATVDLDELINLAAKAAALRERLAQLDAERAPIEAQLADYVNRITAAAVAVGTPPLAEPPAAAPSNEWKDPMSLSAAVLYVLRRTPEKVFTAPEIAGILTMTDSIRGIRTHLWRLAKKGVVTRYSFGKYKAR